MKLYKLLPILVILIFLVTSCGSEVVEDSMDEVSNSVDEKSESLDDTPNLPNPDESSNVNRVNTFTLTGENFKFFMDREENPDIRVNEGDTVRIEFKSTQGFHDWVVDEFNAATERVMDGESTFVEFVVDKKGTFEYYCGVGSHKEQGMKGNLIVE